MNDTAAWNAVAIAFPIEAKNEPTAENAPVMAEATAWYAPVTQSIARWKAAAIPPAHDLKKFTTAVKNPVTAEATVWYVPTTQSMAAWNAPAIAWPILTKNAEIGPQLAMIRTAAATSAPTAKTTRPIGPALMVILKIAAMTVQAFMAAEAIPKALAMTNTAVATLTTKVA